MITLSVKRAKVVTLLCIAFAAVIAGATLRSGHVAAKGDDALEQIAAYRTWTRITENPIRGEGLDRLVNATLAGDMGG